MLGATKNIHKQKNGPKRAKETLGQIEAADFGNGAMLTTRGSFDTETYTLMQETNHHLLCGADNV